MEQFLKTMLENVAIDVQSKINNERGNVILAESDITVSDNSSDIADEFDISRDEQ